MYSKQNRCQPCLTKVWSQTLWWSSAPLNSLFPLSFCWSCRCLESCWYFYVHLYYSCRLQKGWNGTTKPLVCRLLSRHSCLYLEWQFTQCSLAYFAACLALSWIRYTWWEKPSIGLVDSEQSVKVRHQHTYIHDKKDKNLGMVSGVSETAVQVPGASHDSFSS